METCPSWWSVGILHHGSTLVTHALIYCYTYVLKNMCMSVFPTHTTIITHKERLENDVSVWNSNYMSFFHADILFYNRICCFKLDYTSHVMRLCWCCCHIHLSFDVNVFWGTTRTRVFGRLWFGFTRMHQFLYTCVVLYTHTCLTLNTYVFFATDVSIWFRNCSYITYVYVTLLLLLCKVSPKSCITGRMLRFEYTPTCGYLHTCVNYSPMCSFQSACVVSEKPMRVMLHVYVFISSQCHHL